MEEDSVNSLQPAAAGCTASIAIGCMCSPAVMHRNPGFVYCAQCSRQVLLACLMHQFVQSGGYALENSVEWHIAFICPCGLRYVCKTCCESCDMAELGFPAGDSSPTPLGFSNRSDVCSASSLEKLHGKISTVSRRVDDLQNSLSTKLQHLID